MDEETAKDQLVTMMKDAHRLGMKDGIEVVEESLKKIVHLGRIKPHQLEGYLLAVALVEETTKIFNEDKPEL